VISRVSVSLIMCTGGAERGRRERRHFSAASSFQIGVSPERPIGPTGSVKTQMRNLPLVLGTPK
jgi:hypothetical protein